MPLFFPSPGTDTPVGLSFKDTHLHFQTSKLPLREQFAPRVSLSCDLWSMGVARGADLKRWTHLAGAWAEHPHTQIYTQQHACYLFVYFTERLQYHRKNNTANVIVCLFAYFVQSVCQMQIESTRQLQQAPPLPRLPPHACHSPPEAVWTHPAEQIKATKHDSTCVISVDVCGPMGGKVCELYLNVCSYQIYTI